MSVPAQLAALYARMWNVVGRGLVKLVDETKVVQVLQVVFNNELETRDNLYSAGHYGLASSPPVDTDVIALFIGGDRSNGVAVATNHQASRPKNMAQGEVMLFDDQGTKIWLKRGGIVIEAGGRTVDVNNATQVTINASSGVRMVTPKLEVTGDIIDNSGSNTKTLKQLRDNYNAHVHGGVTTGSSPTTGTDHPT